MSTRAPGRTEHNRPRSGRGLELCKRLLLAAAGALAGASPAGAASVAWDGGGDALNWTSAANWSTNTVPTSADDVTIAAGTTVRVASASAARSVSCAGTLQLQNSLTLSATSSIHNLSQSSGTFSVSGDLTLTGTSTWSAGTMSGAGTTVLAAGATLTKTGTAASILSARTFRNEGTFDWQGSGELDLNNGAIFDNPGTFVVQNDVLLRRTAGTATSPFNNSGTFRKQTTTGKTTIDGGVNFVNTGNVVGLTGTMAFSNLSSSSGTHTFSPGATLQFNGGTHTFDAASTLTADLVWIAGPEINSGSATVSVNGTYDVQQTRIGAVGFVNGTLNISHAETMPTLALHTGTVNVAGDLTITNALTWVHGTMTGSGTTIIAPGATVTKTTNATYGGAAIVSARTFRNEGTFDWQGSGEINLNNGAVFDNLGTLIAQGDALLRRMVGTTTGVFNNSGTFRKQSTTGKTTIDGGVNFVNTGNVVGLTGTMAFSNLSSSSGTHTFSPGATLQFNGGTHTFDAASSITADLIWIAGPELSAANATVTVNGTYDVQQTRIGVSGFHFGTLNVTHPATMPTLALVHGTVNVAGDLTITSSLSWFNGTMSGVGSTVLTPGATATKSINATYGGVSTVSARTFRNEGTFVWQGNGEINLNNNAIFDNQGTFLAQVDGLMRRTAGTTTSTFNNFGIFRKGPSTGTTTVDGGICFVNTGLVDVDTGILRFSGCYPNLTGSYNVATTLRIDAVPVPDCSGASITLETAGAQILNGAGASLVGNLDCIETTGALHVQGGKNYATVGPLQNSGLVDVTPGSTVNVNGTYTQLAGTTEIENGTLAAPLIDIQGGLVKAEGLFDGNTRNAGRLEIGVPIGKLDIDGTYLQTAAGTLVFELGGLIPIVEYDQLQISGAATFGGTLEILLANGFAPAQGNEFQIILYPSHTGSFANVLLPPLGSGLGWVVDYGTTAVTLRVVRAAITVTGVVTSDCEGALAGVSVTLVDGAGASVTTTTDSEGAYTFADVLASESPGSIAIAVPAGFAAEAPPAGNNAIALGADTTFDFSVSCIFVGVSGTVSSTCADAAASRTVTLVDGAGTSHTATTSASGAYAFSGIRWSENDGSVGLEAPAGFEASAAAAVDLTASRVADFTLTDIAPPTIEAPATIIAGTDAGNCGRARTTLVLGTPTVGDNCPDVTVAHDAPLQFPLGATLVTWTATDAAGNTATAQQTITIEDREPPVLTVPANLSLTTGAAAMSCSRVVTAAELGAATAEDGCSNATVTIDGLPAGSAFPVGTTTLTYTAVDAAGNTVSATRTVTLTDDTPPVITCPANVVVGTDPGSCTAAVAFPVAASDNCSGAVVTATPASGSQFPVGTTSVSIAAVDGAGNTQMCSFTVTVENGAPAVAIAGPASGSIYSVGTPVSFTGTFTDDAGDVHEAVWLIDTQSIPGAVDESAHTVTASHTFNAAGVYKIRLTLSDQCDQSATTNMVGEFEALVVVYDPSAGFVTGGGWIQSPSGAFLADPALAGRANFGFVSKYQRGATVPTGQTEFQFRVANLNFHSSSYEWLVVAGARAQYRGTGTINQAGDYAFLLTAIDGQQNGGGDVDKLRMKIWNRSTNALVYDNQMGAGDGDDPTTPIGGGSIVIHRGGASIASASMPEVGSGAASDLPLRFALRPNYPEPFNPTTTIEFDLPVPSTVRLLVYDVRGRIVRTLAAGTSHAAGRHRVTFDGAGLGSGVYFAAFEAGTFRQTRKMLLVK